MPRHILIADGPAQPDLTEIDDFWARAESKFDGLGGNYQVRSLGIDAETTTQITWVSPKHSTLLSNATTAWHISVPS